MNRGLINTLGCTDVRMINLDTVKIKPKIVMYLAYK